MNEKIKPAQQPKHLSQLEGTVLKTFVKFLELRNPFEYPPHEPWDKIWFNKLVEETIQGNVGGRPFVLEKELSYAECVIELTGEENLPQSEPFIFVANHYKRGKHRGNWQAPAMAHAIASNIPNGLERHHRFLIEGKKEHLEQIEKKVKASRLYNYLPDRLKNTVDLGLAKTRTLYEETTSNVLLNLARTTDLFLTGRDTLSILTFLRKGGILGLYPTGTDELELNPILEEAAEFIALAGKFDIPVVPIGAYHIRSTGLYHLNIGEPRLYNPDNLRSKRDIQGIAHDIGIRIAKQLPAEPVNGHYLRGYYTNNLALPS